MFEAAELGVTVDKVHFKKEAQKLRVALLEAQRELINSNLSAIVVVGGVEGSGKTEVVNLLLEWMDARGIEVFALSAPTDEERERPRFWRFWRALPPKGKLGVFIGSWYTQPIVERTFKVSDEAALDQELDRIAAFEKMLVQENTVLLKFWLHLSKPVQKKHLARLEKDPATRWRVTKQDWKFFRKYDKFRKVSEHALLKTNTSLAPWTIVDAQDKRHRSLAVARELLAQLRARQGAAKGAADAPKPALPKPKKVNLLSKLDLSLSLPEKEYDKRLADYQGRLNLLARKMRDKKRSLILVFEGPDAAGKGGTIRRLTTALDARSYQVISTAAPTDEERSHPYLWRFWRRLPRQGRTTIYDRSWYGRVLVERLEGFCRPEDWRRAYEEINAFESDLADFGVLVLKFWIALSPEEQLRRFQEREKTPYKRHKITQEDWRNRDKWDAYQAAACDMIERTSTDKAPWVTVEGVDKRWARVKTIKTTCERLERILR